MKSSKNSRNESRLRETIPIRHCGVAGMRPGLDRRGRPELAQGSMAAGGALELRVAEG